MKHSTLVSVLGLGLLLSACAGESLDTVSEQSDGTIVVHETKTVYVPQVVEVAVPGETKIVTLPAPAQAPVQPPVIIVENPILAPEVIGSTGVTSALHAKGVVEYAQGSYGNIGTRYVCTSEPTPSGAAVHTLATHIVSSTDGIGTAIGQCSAHGWPVTNTCSGTAIPDAATGELRFFLDNCEIPAAVPGSAARCVMVDVDCGFAADAPIGQSYTLGDVTQEEAHDTIVAVNGDVIAMVVDNNASDKPVISIVAVAAPEPTHVVSTVFGSPQPQGNSTGPVYRFTVSATSKDFTFTSIVSELDEIIDSEGVLLLAVEDSSSVRRFGDGADLEGYSSLVDTDGNFCNNNSVSCTFRTQFNQPQTIAAGTSRTYDIRLTVAGNTSDEDFIAMSRPEVL